MIRKLLLSVIFLITSTTVFSQFKSGNLVVLRVGDGNSNLSSNATKVSLVETSINGIASGVVLDLNATGSEALTLSGLSLQEGGVKLSSNGMFLSVGGYNLASDSTITTAYDTRIIARLGVGGTSFNYTTKILGSSVTGNLRSVYPNDAGTGFYVSTSTRGLSYVPFSNSYNTAAVSLSNVVGVTSNCFSSQILDNQLYASFLGSSTAEPTISKVGVGIPTTRSQGLTTLVSGTANSAPTYRDFILLDGDISVAGPDLLYVVDGREIKKFSLVSGAWVPNGSVNVGSVIISLTGYVNPFNRVELFTVASTLATGSAGNSLKKLIDNAGFNADLDGSNGFETILTAPNGYSFRGVAFTPGTSVNMTLLANSGSSINSNPNGIQLNTNNTPKITLLNNGNVGIGTTIPDFKLTVKGKVHAEEIKVDLAVPGPDYVFEDTYKLTTLAEIKQYIEKNKHLPEVPSAKEMETQGVNLSEMNMILLKKIEELTLHLINQDIRLKNQELEIQKLKK